MTKIPIKKTTPMNSTSSVKSRTPAPRTIPNSAMLSAMGRSSASSSVDRLGDALRMRMQAQIPRAEREADTLSASIHTGTPESVKQEMGRRMGADFSDVHFHIGADAAAKAEAVDSRAFTSGNDIYFGEGGFDPAIAAHELVHTAQQGVVESATPTMSAPVGGIQRWGKKKNPPKASEAPAQNGATNQPYGYGMPQDNPMQAYQNMLNVNQAVLDFNEYSMAKNPLFFPVTSVGEMSPDVLQAFIARQDEIANATYGNLDVDNDENANTGMLEDEGSRMASQEPLMLPAWEDGTVADTPDGLRDISAAPPTAAPTQKPSKRMRAKRALKRAGNKFKRMFR